MRLLIFNLFNILNGIENVENNKIKDICSE